MRIVSWNIRKAKEDSRVWELLRNYAPDIVLLQEVIHIPEDIQESYGVIMKNAAGKEGKGQLFSTAVLVKGKDSIVRELVLTSQYEWVNKELEYFKGNLIACTVQLDGFPSVNVISVYSPAWPVDPVRLEGINVTPVKLKLNPQVWVTELLWAALKNVDLKSSGQWIVGGDFNSSETFDYLWDGGPRGNLEIIHRMQNLGFNECLREYNGKLTPTFRNPKGGKIIHQIDHVYVTDPPFSALVNCFVGDESAVFEESMSDHLPIIADFTLQV